MYQWQIVKSLDLIESQDWKCQGKTRVPGFSYVWCVLGKEVLNARFNGLL